MGTPVIERADPVFESARIADLYLDHLLEQDSRRGRGEGEFANLPANREDMEMEVELMYAKEGRLAQEVIDHLIATRGSVLEDIGYDVSEYHIRLD